MMRICRTCTKPVLISGLVLLTQAGAALAQQRPGIRLSVNPPEDCYISEPVEAESIYSFLRVEIQALALAQRGEWSNSEMLETEGGALIGQGAKTMAGLREERIDNTCSSFVVSQYADSKNQAVAATAKYLASAYDELGKMSDQMLGITLQKSLRRVNGLSPQRQFAMLMDRRKEILGKMTDALNLSLMLLVDESRTDEQGRLDHLVLRKAQIKELLDYMYARFPSLHEDNKKDARSGSFIKQAALIQAFLTGSYRPADLP